MNARTLNLLLAAQSLLDNSGPELTAMSDALTVSRKVLSAHDAVELALGAILIETGNASKLRADFAFQELVGLVVKEVCKAEDEPLRRAYRDDLMELNRIRVRFKHYGDLFDVNSTYPLVEAALRTLDDLCLAAFARPLRAVSSLQALANEHVRSHFHLAEICFKEGRYKDSLAAIALALAFVFEVCELHDITVGVPSTDGALLLTGRGVDAATFLELQRFLPKAHTFDDSVHFDLREYGHEANWTMENTKFCFETGLTVALRLQHSQRSPHAASFYEEFDDVLTIKVDDTLAYRYEGWHFGEHEAPTAVLKFPYGASVLGKVEGYLSRQGVPISLEYADWVKVTNHDVAGAQGNGGLGYIDELWFQLADVELTYQRSRQQLTLDEWRRSLSGDGSRSQ